MKLRIAIVVLGLLTGLIARVAVHYYEQFRSQRSVTPQPAAASPLIQSKPAK